MDTNQASAIAEYNAGVTCHHGRRAQAAIAHYKNAIQLLPGLVEARFNLGNAFCEADELQLAIETYQELLLHHPDYAKAAYNLGAVYQRLGRHEDALKAYHQALQAQPDYTPAMNNIGVILRDSDDIEKALEYFEQALSVKPDFAQAHYNCGVALQKKGEYELGRQYYQRAIAHHPNYAPAHWLNQLSLPMIYERPGDIDRYRRQFAANITKLIDSIKPDNARDREFALQGIASTTNFFLQYQCRNDLELQKQYGRFVCQVMAAEFPHWARPLPMPSWSGGQKIRIGYVSSLMYAHTIGVFLLGWVKNHQRDDFRIYCYHLGDKMDALTEQLAGHAHRFYHMAGDIQTAAKQITKDELHILVHTDIGMNPITLQLASLRLAPVQCKGWGHPVTTGLPTIDYYLSSDLMEPEDAHDHYSEKLIRLPNLALCYSPPAMPADPRSRSFFGIPEESFVYLSPQSLYKYLPQHDDIYPQIASQVPSAKFVFIQNPSAALTDKFKQRLQRSFRRHGMDAGRYCIFMRRMNHADFLSLNHCVDAILDTLEWSGGKTTLEALSCGLPVLTCPGRLMRGRHALAMLKRINAADTIADDKASYCALAVRLARDRDFYRRVHSQILNNRDLLYQDHVFMRALEDFYRSAVKGLPAGSHKSRPRRPDKAIDCYNRGVACHRQQNYAEAIRHYRRALELRPEWPDAMYNLACALKMQSDFQSALDLFIRLVELDPENAKACLQVGILHLERGDGAQALPMLARARQGLPDNAVVLNNLGKAYALQKMVARARRFFELAARLDPDLAEAWFNLAELYAAENRPQDAIDHYRLAIEKQPGMQAAYNNMGNMYRKMKRFQEAAGAFRKVIEHNPQLAEAHFNLGSTCLDNEQYDQAVHHLSTALRLKPGYADAWNNLALACKNMGDLDRARSYLDKALQIDANLSLAHWNRSFIYLLQGDWLNGWKDFEWRFQTPQWRTLYPHRIEGERWDGKPMPGRTLLVHDEQGLGDTLQFVRYLPLARQRCGRLILETRRELTPLFNGLAGTDHIIIRSIDHPPKVAFDQYIPLMSLAGLLATTPDALPLDSPYIQAPADATAHWRQHLPHGGFKVGLVWAGRPEHANDGNRSCDLKQISTLLDLDQVQFVALQKGPAARQIKTIQNSANIIQLGEQLKDFADTAGVLMNLDLVITVDTSVAHLAGALGRPVWVLIPYIPDWRWMMTGQRTPWYPTMSLFRQRNPKQWRAVIDDIKLSLVAAVDKRTGTV